MDVAVDGHTGGGFSVGEPVILSSSIASVSNASTVAALEELHAYLSIVIIMSNDASIISKSSLADRLALEWIREDEKLLEDVQIFRPASSDGLALHYRVIRDDAETILSLASHISAATKAGSKSGGSGSNNSSIPAGCVGIVFCVGFSGLPHATGSSYLQHSLPQRMLDCTTILNKIQDSNLIRTILSTFLLAEDDHRRSNEMVQAPNLVAFSTADDTDKARSLLSPMAMMSPFGQAMSPFAGNVASGVSTVASGVASGVSTVASGVTTVASGVVNFSKRMSMTGALGASGRGGLAAGATSGAGRFGMNGLGTGDGPSSEQRGITVLALRPNSAEVALVMTERMNVLSVAESDTTLRKYTTTGHERKANLDLTGTGKSRFRRRKADARDPDLDGFDYKGPTKEGLRKKFLAPETIDTFSSTASVTGSVATGASGASTQKQSSLRQPRSKTAAVPTLSASGKDSTTSRRASAFQISDDYSQASGQKSSTKRRSTLGPTFEDEASLTSEGRSRTSGTNDSMSSTGRVQVNIALNEDLSCSYKLSQLSSCSVEGVVQVRSGCCSDWFCGIDHLLTLFPRSKSKQRLDLRTPSICCLKIPPGTLIRFKRIESLLMSLQLQAARRMEASIISSPFPFLKERTTSPFFATSALVT
jgi:hypothetical protein